MPTLHSIHRCGVITHVGVPKNYNIPQNSAENGNKTKTYKITSQAKRKIRSSLVKMWYEKQNRLTFWTFTFKLSNETGKVVGNQKILNAYFSSLLENAKKTYGLASYIWVSERTKNGCIHYHCVFDVPKLENLKNKTLVEIKKKGGKVFEHFLRYYKNSFRACLKVNGIAVDDSIDYCSVGFPRKYDANGVLRGSVIRSLDALAGYLTGYLVKCQREETEGRIYAVSRSILEKPVRLFNINIFEVPVKTVELEHCSIDYYKLSKGYDDFFIKSKEEEKTAIVTESDLARKERLYDRIWRNKHMKISASLKIPHNSYMKYIRNAPVLRYVNYFANVSGSQYRKVFRLSPLTVIKKKRAIFLQESFDFVP